MFTWICPQCGAEVPPSESSCPNCAAKESAPSTEAPAAAPAAQPPAPPAAPQGARKAYAPAVPRAARSGGVPGWVVALLVAGFLVSLGAIWLLYVLPNSRAREAASQTAPPPLETVAATPAPGGKPHPLAKYIEVTGFRITEDAKKNVQIKYLVVNHSGADLSDLVMELTIRPATARPEDKPVAAFSAKVPSLGPYESREITSTTKTEYRAYELPDWQFLRAEFRITSPPAE